jgi:hypothetical protein
VLERCVHCPLEVVGLETLGTSTEISYVAENSCDHSGVCKACRFLRDGGTPPSERVCDKALKNSCLRFCARSLSVSIEQLPEQFELPLANGLLVRLGARSEWPYLVFPDSHDEDYGLRLFAVLSDWTRKSRKNITNSKFKRSRALTISPSGSNYSTLVQ